MQLLERRIVRIPLYGLFTLVVFLIALVLTFPDTRVKEIVIVQAEQALNKGKSAEAGDRIWDVNIADLDLWWLTGLELEGVELKERWSEEKLAQVAAEAKEGAPPQKPLTVTIPRVAGRVSIMRSLFNLGLAAVYDVDFEDGGLITGTFVQGGGEISVSAAFEDVDMFRSSIMQSVTGVPGFGTLNGTVLVELDPKTRKPKGGTIDLRGKKLTVGPATVKTEMLPSMAYLEVPQTNFGTFVMKAHIESDSRGAKLVFDEFNAKGRDVRMDVWGDAGVGNTATANVDMRLQFDATFVKENSLSPVLNMQIFRSGKSSDDWYGMSFKGPISKLRPRGSVIAARGPAGTKASTGASGGVSKDSAAKAPAIRRNVRPKKQVEDEEEGQEVEEPEDESEDGE